MTSTSSNETESDHEEYVQLDTFIRLKKEHRYYSQRVWQTIDQVIQLEHKVRKLEQRIKEVEDKFIVVE